MKVIDPGHEYDLDWLDGEPEFNVHPDRERPRLQENRLLFVKREGPGYPGNVGHHPGTNMQEVLRAVIDRLKYLNKQIPDPLNQFALTNLRSAIFNLELRAAQRHGRAMNYSLAEIDRIETLPTCSKCGHIGCYGSCHV